MSKRPRSSSMWSYFKISDTKEKIAKCDMCGTNLSYKSTTSNLKNHILKKHPTVNLELSTFNETHHLGLTTLISGGCEPSLPSTSGQNLPLTSQGNSSITSAQFQPDVTQSSTSQSKVVKQTNMACFVGKKISAGQKRKLDRSLLRIFTKDYQPFTVVEDSGFRNFVTDLNPSYNLPDRKTISSTMITAAFEECKFAVQEKLKSVQSVCLTTDCWSSCSQESYLALTAHFVTDEFTFESVLLDCSLIEGSHTSYALACKIREITDSFAVSDKVSVVVSDNGSNIKGAIINELHWNHFGCYAHTLNLIVQGSLRIEIIQVLMEKVKTIVKHFKRSNQDLEKFMKYQKDAGEKRPKKLILDVSTRWSSTYYMLDRLTCLQEAVRATLALLDKAIPAPSLDEWKLCTDLCKVLKPFEEATRKLSGEKYVSGSQIIFITTGLTYVCQKLMKMPLHATAMKVTHLLQEGILTRFSNIENNKIVGTCSFLDPRFKLFPFTSSTSQNVIKEHIKKLATAESKAERENNLSEVPVAEDAHTQNSNRQGESEAADELSFTSFLDEIIRKAQPPGTALSSAIVEVQRYLEERTIDRKQDPLKWWEQKKHLYPILSKIVKKKFNMVATSVPCESIFSKQGLMINDRRTRLKSSKVRQLIFLHVNDKYWSKC